VKKSDAELRTDMRAREAYLIGEILSQMKGEEPKASGNYRKE